MSKKLTLPTAAQRSQVARSMGADLSLFPVLSRLFHQIPALGCRPFATARALSTLSLKPTSFVIDVACGKGAVSLRLAQRTGCQVFGFDACAAFINQARERALALALNGQCHFEVQMYQQLKLRPKYDVAVMIGLLPAQLAAPLIRQLVPPGGFYVVDDCIRIHAETRHIRNKKHQRTHAALWEQVKGAATRDTIESALQAQGDSIVRYCPESTRDASRRLKALEIQLASNIRAIVRSDPKYKSTLKNYMEYQKQARLLLSGPLRSTFWIVKRGGLS